MSTADKIAQCAALARALVGYGSIDIRSRNPNDAQSDDTTWRAYAGEWQGGGTSIDEALDNLLEALRREAANKIVALDRARAGVTS